VENEAIRRERVKRAILMRHASAREAQRDELRELSAAGEEEAARAGAKIAALGADWAPTLALCSNAVRAAATLASALTTLPARPRSEVDARLYLASASELLSALQRVAEREACVLVIAHEPGLSDLVRQLAHRGEPALRARFAGGMPPASFAALELDVTSWADAAWACAELAAFER
jgi:phosphohistidine phosphatase